MILIERKVHGWLAIGLLFILCSFSKSVVANHSNDFLKNNWKVASTEIRAIVKSQSPVDKVILFTADTKMLIQALPFYKGVSVVAVYGSWEPEQLTIYYLITDKGEIERITGRSDLLNRIGKAGRFSFSSNYIDNYVWFRLFFTRNKEHSPFLVLESTDATYFPDLTAIENSLAAQVTNNIKPITCLMHNSVTYRCSASVLYEKVIYAVNVDVNSDGGVDFIDDKPLVSKIPYDPRIPLGVWALKDKIKPKNANTKEQVSVPQKEGWSF